jgi:hypothetical protein
LLRRAFALKSPAEESRRLEPDPVSVRSWSSWTHTASALSGFVFSALVYYPGLFTPDSMVQFNQAQSGAFTDWHPPAMAALWRTLDFIHVGPEPLFFVHLSLFWIGAWAVGAGLVRRGWRWGALFPLIGLTPFVFNYIGMLWKDVALASAWIFAAGWAFRRFAYEAKLRTLDHALIWPVFLYGALVRANSIFACAPLALYLLSGDVFSRKLWPQASALMLVPLLALVATAAVNHGLLRAHGDHPEDSLMLFDLMGVSHRIGVNIVPGPWTPAEAAKIPECYGADKWDHASVGNCSWVIEAMGKRRIWGAERMRDAWLGTMAHDPGDYVAHRLTFTNQIFRWLGPIPIDDAFLESEMPDARWAHRPGPIFRFYEEICNALSKTPLFRPYFWLLASLGAAIAAGFAAPAPQRRFAGALSASAIIYWLTYIPFGVASDFRYSYWSIVATLAALFALPACKVRRSRALFASVSAVMLAAIAASALS